MQAAQWFVEVLAVYGSVGIAFAIAFVTIGIQRVDSVARHAPLGFRLIVLPGAMAFWPWLLLRWARGVRS